MASILDLVDFRACRLEAISKPQEEFAKGCWRLPWRRPAGFDLKPAFSSQDQKSNSPRPPGASLGSILRRGFVGDHVMGWSTTIVALLEVK